LRRQSGIWKSTDAAFNEQTQSPWLTKSTDETLLATFIKRELPSDSIPEGIIVQRSQDGGATWSAETQVISTGLSPENRFIRTYDPKIFHGTGDTYHLVFPYATPQSSLVADQMWHSVSHDGGRTWSEPGPINPADGGDTSPFDAVVDDAGRLHVVYYQSPRFASPTGNRLIHTVWTGGTWRSPRVLSNAPLSFDRHQGVALAVDPYGCVHAVWDEITEWDSKTSQFQYERLTCDTESD
jgi:hypothetical protein